MALRGKTDFHAMKTLPNIGWRFNKQYCSVKRLNERREYILTWISEYGIRTCLTDKELQSAFKVLQELSVRYDKHPITLSRAMSAVAKSYTLFNRIYSIDSELPVARVRKELQIDSTLFNRSCEL